MIVSFLGGRFGGLSSPPQTDTVFVPTLLHGSTQSNQGVYTLESGSILQLTAATQRITGFWGTVRLDNPISTNTGSGWVVFVTDNLTNLNGWGVRVGRSSCQLVLVSGTPDAPTLTTRGTNQSWPAPLSGAGELIEISGQRAGLNTERTHFLNTLHSVAYTGSTSTTTDGGTHLTNDWSAGATQDLYVCALNNTGSVQTWFQNSLQIQRHNLAGA